MKKIILPSSVTTVEKYAFAKCSSLRVISFPKETVTLIDNILYDCGKILNFAAPKLSKAYSYAEKKGIAVTTTNKIKFASSHIYLLAGDTDTIPLLNCINTVTYKSKKKSVVSVTKSGKNSRKKERNHHNSGIWPGGKKYQYKVTVYRKSSWKTGKPDYQIGY